MAVPQCWSCSAQVGETAQYCAVCGGLVAFERARYRIRRRMGSGGFGEVYEAVDTKLNRRCAVKVIRLATGLNRTLLDHEWKILRDNASRFPFIPDIYDVCDDAAHIYLVMEYVEGTPIDSLARPWTVPQVEVFLRTILSHLAQIHTAGVIHRDLKPSNILLDSAGRYTLIDFGISQSDRTIALSKPALAGSPLYAPPEQWSGPADLRSDLYSLGATAYELLTGTPPPSAAERMAGKPLPRPSSQVAGVPIALEQTILALLELNVAARPANAALARSMIDQVVPPTEVLPRPRSKGANVRGWIIGGVLGLVLLCGIGAGVIIGLNPGSGGNGPTPIAQPLVDPGSPESPAPFSTPRPTSTRGPTHTPPPPTSTPRPTTPPQPPGAITDLQQIARFVAGPMEGSLVHDDDNFVEDRDTGVDLRGFIAEARFYNPFSTSDGTWDYGLMFRDTDVNNQYRLIITSAKQWALYFGTEDKPKASGPLSNLDISASGSNIIRLIASLDRAFLFVNGRYIDTMSISGKITGGDISPTTGFFTGSEIVGRETTYDRFVIWSLDEAAIPVDFWPGELVADDTFTDNSNNWTVSDDEYKTTELSDGKLTMTFKQKNWMTWEIWSPVKPQNFVVEVDYLATGPYASGGVVFGLQDNGNFLAIRVGNTGKLTLEQQRNNEWVKPSLLPWQAHPAIKPNQLNRLVVARQGELIQIYINSVWAAEFRTSEFSGGAVGLTGSTDESADAVVGFESFRLWTLP